MQTRNEKALDPFDAATWERVDRVIAEHKGQPGALIPVLEEIQGITGYLPEPVQRWVARGLDLPLSQVYGVVTFYSFFTMKPRGKHEIRVCLGTACHVRGNARNLEQICHALGIQPGDCTADREFSLEIVRCLGACGLAPVMTVGEDTHRQVKQAHLGKILHGYRGPESAPGA